MFDKATLANGLTIIGERLPHFRSVSIGVWIAAGSQHETAEECGLSHFLEHMLFKGTQKRTARKIAEDMDEVGGQINAFTAKEFTCYYVKVIDQHIELALDVLSDITLHSTIDENELEKEKGVILEEIAMAEDEPEDLAHELIMQAHYGDQPLSRPILGRADTVKNCNRCHIISYQNRLYRADRAVLAVAGNYDWDALITLTERYFSEWAGGGGTCECKGVTPQPRLIRREKSIEQIHICISYPGYPLRSEEQYPMMVFNGILGGSMSSRLFQKIREERGLAYSVYSYPAFYLNTGILAIYAGTSQQHAETVLDIIHDEIRSFIAHGITDDEFLKTREQIKGNYVLSQESASARMNALGRRMLLHGDTQTEDDIIKKIDAIQREAVNALINTTLSSACAAALVGRGADSLDMNPLIG